MSDDHNILVEVSEARNATLKAVRRTGREITTVESESVYIHYNCWGDPIPQQADGDPMSMILPPHTDG